MRSVVSHQQQPLQRSSSGSYSSILAQIALQQLQRSKSILWYWQQQLQRSRSSLWHRQQQLQRSRSVTEAWKQRLAARQGLLQLPGTLQKPDQWPGAWDR